MSFGLNPYKLIDTEKALYLEFEKMNLLTNLKIIKLPNKDFSSAMKILDNELGKNRVRNSKFLREKFKKFSKYFIGIYLNKELIGIVCGFPREDYFLMSEIAIDCRFQKRGFGKRLVKEFEKRVFEKYKKLHVGALDNSIEFYKSLNYLPFLLIQFNKGDYNKENFSNFDILKINDYMVELRTNECNLKELREFRELYPKANLQYIFTKETKKTK